MKTTISLLLALATLLTSCNSSRDDTAPAKTFRFSCKADWSGPKLKGTLAADGTSMTDLWVFDYVGGVLSQIMHQSSADETFGTVEMPLDYGSHNLYFVASRGKVPTVDTEAGSIVWGTPSDTFWKEYDVDVNATATTDRTVTLDRVATKLRLVITDEVPASISSVKIIPSVRYYGLDYIGGTPLESKSDAFTIAVPASYVGTVGQLSMGLFSLSGTTEWATNVVLQALDASNSVLGTVTLNDVPLLRNRTTEYSGPLFSSPGTTDVGLSADWLTPYTGTW